MPNQSHKFKGGLRVGLLANSWPNGELEISKDDIICRDLMFKKEYRFSKEEVTKIEIKKVFPIIGKGIRIHHTNPSYSEKIYFWYVGFKFNNLLSTLKELGWSI